MIRQYFLYPFFDATMIYASGFLADFTTSLITTVNVLTLFIAGFVARTVLRKLFTNKRNRYHWTKFQANPKKYFTGFSGDKSIIMFIRCLITGYTWLFFYLGILTIFITYFPDDGLHVWDMISNPNTHLQALMIFFTLTGLVAGFKACQYVALGVLDSVWNFKLKMIFLP